MHNLANVISWLMVLNRICAAWVTHSRHRADQGFRRRYPTPILEFSCQRASPFRSFSHRAFSTIG